MFNRYQPRCENTVFDNLPHIVKQQGSSLVLALFVIIVLTLLGSVLMRMISTSSETVSQEVLGTRAYMAANSAMQAELQQLFPLNSAASGYCDTPIINKDHVLKTISDNDIPGLYDCRAITSCNNFHSDLINSVEYYRLTSTGKCGSGSMNADSKVIVKSSRTIQVEARSL